MRHPLCMVVVATLLIAAVIDVFAAGVKTSAVTQFCYAAPTSGVGIAVPPGMKFPTEFTAAVIRKEFRQSSPFGLENL